MKRVPVAVGAMLIPAALILVRTPAGRVTAAGAVAVFAVAGGVTATALRSSRLLGAAGLALGAEYAISLASRGAGIDPLAPVIALLIYGAVELVGSAIDLTAVRVTRGAFVHHLGVLLRVGFAAWIACLLVLGSALVSSPRGTGARLLGAAGACAAVMLLVVLTKRSRARAVRNLA